jgi:hypothetical protein
MGYSGPTGYGMQIPAYRVGGHAALWDIRGYGLSLGYQKYGLRGADCNTDVPRIS